jgi:hypothetical protein
MKLIPTLLLLISVAYGQTKPNLSHANKTGWIPTGKTQIWPATIYDRNGKTVKGFVRVREESFVPASMQSGPNIWHSEGTLYDSKMKVIKITAGGHIEYNQPKTVGLKRE